MPGKAKADESLLFLYTCLLHSGGMNSINFNSVAEATNLNVSAARMRWHRLKIRIEKEIAEGPGDGTAGEASDMSTPAVSPAKAAVPRKKRVAKRKKLNNSEPDEAVQGNADANSPSQEKELGSAACA
ncbi:hypothetical protein BDV25DRAFT_142583 [Aspergillus avenaceus]|uniref:Myb-like DNA-binding domain-containing protein n=1 Tax=Aspergillus avenaceus TaxID=36643 RepID=A0A5N6TND4_ASPAV|nr:hypothetical protein BDV25DRAFT_142583 [Aspergillus avenaceus]